MQIDQVLPYMREGEWKTKLREFADGIRGHAADLDDALGPIGRRVLAAGVYIRARKLPSH